MSPDSDTPTLYIAEFIDGPLEGQIDSRALVRGKHAPRISMVAAVGGLESVFWYDEVDERDVSGQLRVRYAFDQGDSDPIDTEVEPL
ncbi:hypothetical protein SAMN05216368_10839 [Cryobacterium flavum]|uniref:Uncharacterized protein n=1 Tax=Cryobacterium flavum TaxID=1424659 RepID=A0A4R8VFZ9_9MICO|nr:MULTISPECIES: hypothetical protein [Cryobacterium]TFB82151.1 hypothetical protein E3O21_00375 [Cryobacterium flavum]TFD09418.1 hypothetical protein E3T29_04565 [Cryobacterium sp. TMT1-66-1]TFD11857.1 hypothetical protein E3T35_08705 [Cryobacterium sp. TMT1-2-2]SDN89444.1 hypothetical protein SAMN05216368_10839 [Cryobacterium flavum]